MSFIFKFPDIGEGIAEGKILEWYVEVGQSVKMGENIVKMETDKVVADIPSPRTGVILKRFGEREQVINVGDPLVEIAEAGKKCDSSEKPISTAKEKSVGVVGTLEEADDKDFLPASMEGLPKGDIVEPKHKSLATPAVRAFARKSGVDINKITGTGPKGRVTREDIRAYLSRQETGVPVVTSQTTTDTALVEYAPLTQIRKTIAKRMILSKQTAAHMTVFEEVEICELDRLRDCQKEKFTQKGASLTYLPFILKAVVQGLKQYRVLNSQLEMDKERIVYRYEYNIGIAVDAPDGLVVPVIRNVERLSIYDLSVEIARLAQLARERRLTLNELQGGTFTVTNFGAIAGTYGVPVINYPEVAILGVGRVRKMPVVKGNAIQIGTVMPLSLSVDHRIVDGGDATRFLKTVMEMLADPTALLMF